MRGRGHPMRFARMLLSKKIKTTLRPSLLVLLCLGMILPADLASAARDVSSDEVLRYLAKTIPMLVSDNNPQASTDKKKETPPSQAAEKKEEKKEEEILSLEEEEKKQTEEEQALKEAIDREVAKAVGKNDEKEKDVYLSPATDVYALWNKLRIKDDLINQERILFGCDRDREECFLSNPRVDITEHGDYKILRLLNRSFPDYQYFFFKKRWEPFYFTDHLEYFDQKYQEPKFSFLQEDLLSVTWLSEQSPRFVAYETALYQLVEGRLKKLLQYYSFFKSGEAWGELFDVVLRTERVYDNEVLTLKFDISITMNDHSYISEFDGALPKTPIVRGKKKVIFQRLTDGFEMDMVFSTTTLEQMALLCGGGRGDYYSVFMKQFDQVKTENPKVKEWLKEFKKGLAENG